LECLAKTDMDEANVFSDHFSSVYVVKKDTSYDILPIKENFFSMPNISFNDVDIATKLKN